MENIINTRKISKVPDVILGRSNILTSRLGLGCAVWPLKCTYEQTVNNLRTAFAVGVMHIDIAPLYGTEEIIGKALKDANAPTNMVLSTKVCSYKDDLGIAYRDYSNRTAYRSVIRSLRRLQVDHLSIVHLHDVEPQNLAQVFSKNGALQALLDLKDEGIIKSIGMATFSLECLEAAIDCGEIDHIQPYHSNTLLNQEAKKRVIPKAHIKNLSVIDNAPYAGWILATGVVPDACYNYKPAPVDVVKAVKQLEKACQQKGVSLQSAALALSLLDPKVSVTVVGMSSPARIYERLSVFDLDLKPSDFVELIGVAGGPFPLTSPYPNNPANVDD